jgi:hypothetical protein
VSSSDLTKAAIPNATASATGKRNPTSTTQDVQDKEIKLIKQQQQQQTAKQQQHRTTSQHHNSPCPPPA